MSRLALVLHAHQPEVPHMGWHAEALRECYTPLIDWIRRKRPRLTMSVSPSLLRLGFPPIAGLDSVQWITTTESHAILPLLRDDDARLRQLVRGRRQFEAWASATPQGVWVPELAYAPGLDALLVEAGYRYTVLEAPAGMTRAGLKVFARDPALSRHLWSRDEGIPGHPLYRDFYAKDCAVTAKHSAHKQPYDADKARLQAQRHADAIALDGTVVAAFDAELFGHWWFEGPVFLEALFDRIEGVTLSELTVSGTSEPAQGSWGQHGDLRTWLNEDTAWITAALHEAQAVRTTSEQALRALAQAEASDWPYMITRRHYEDVATQQVRESLRRFAAIHPL